MLGKQVETKGENLWSRFLAIFPDAFVMTHEQSVTPRRFTSSVDLIPRRSYQSCQEVIKNVPVVPHTRSFVTRVGFSGRPKEGLSPDPLQQEQHLCGR